jgi:hypothetical protein
MTILSEILTEQEKERAASVTAASVAAEAQKTAEKNAEQKARADEIRAIAREEARAALDEEVAIEGEGAADGDDKA